MPTPDQDLPDASEAWSTHTWCQSKAWFFRPASGARWPYRSPCKCWTCDDCRPVLVSALYPRLESVLTRYPTLHLCWYPADKPARSSLSSWASSGRSVDYLAVKIDLGSVCESRRAKWSRKEREIVNNAVLLVVSDAPIMNRSVGRRAEIPTDQALRQLYAALGDAAAAPRASKGWRDLMARSQEGIASASPSRLPSEAAVEIGRGYSAGSVQDAIRTAIEQMEEEAGIEIPWAHGGPPGLPCEIDPQDLVARVKRNLGTHG